MIGNICRNYRIAKGVTLHEIEGDKNIKTLSAFEMGRSSNIKHFLKYFDYAVRTGDLDTLIKFIINRG